MAKRPSKQLTLDLVFSEPPKAEQVPACPKRSLKEEPEVEVVEAVAVQEISPPFQDHESAIRRETTAYDLYQSASRDTRNLLLISVVFALFLLGTKSGAGTVEKLSWFGVELTIRDRSKISGVLALGALFFSLWTVYSAWCMSALWRKCGLFYCEIVQPSDNPYVKALHRALWILGAVSVGVVILYSVTLAIWDIVYLFFPYPGDWETKVIPNL